MTAKRCCTTAMFVLVAASIAPAVVRAALHYEGVKFWVYRAEQPGAVRLWRVLLADGSHLYTVDKREVDRLVRAKRGVVEPMEAFVVQKPTENMVRLYRFALAIDGGVFGCFYTAFTPEAKEVASRPTARTQPMGAFVYPHDIKPSIELSNPSSPCIGFTMPRAASIFYTTSEVEKDGLVKKEKGTPTKVK